MKRPGEAYDTPPHELAEEYYSEETLTELRRRVEGVRTGAVKTVPTNIAYRLLGV
jgi:hypothetical protein